MGSVNPEIIMIIIQIILSLFIIFVVFNVISRYRKKEITAHEFIFWIFFWALVLTAIVYPRSTDKIAKIVGVSRGADLLVYLSIFALFFIVFRIFVKIEKTEKNITKIIRKIAIDEAKSGEKNNIS